MEDVYVSGIGVVTASGAGVQDFWSALTSGRSGIREVTRFDTQWLPIQVAAEIKDLEHLPDLSPEEVRRFGPINRLALSCTRSALANANLLNTKGQAKQSSMEMYLGTIHGDAGEHIRKGRKLWDQVKPRNWITLAHHLMTDNVSFGFLLKTAQLLGITGMQSINTNACTASGYAICIGAERIRQGCTDIALCGGMDLLAEAEYVGFCSLRAMAPEKCASFDIKRKGLIIGEGGGVLILESGTSLRRRKQKALAKLAGYGCSNDAYHLSIPHPEGWGTVRAVSEALRDAQLDARDIDCIVAHGTGTPLNDRIEAQAFKQVFGNQSVPVTAPKSILGHCMGAASAVEAIVGILALQKQKVPFTLNHTETDPECPVNIVQGNVLETQLHTCLTNSVGFGGNNDSLIFTQAEDEVRRYA